MNLEGERLVPRDEKHPFYIEHLQRYRFAKRYVQSKRVLDLGCGVGYGTLELKKIGAKEVVGVDIDSKAIEYAKKKFEKKGVLFMFADGKALPFNDKSFDVVVSFEVVEHIKSYQKFINEALRVLKGGGYFIFSTPNALGVRARSSPYHFKEFTASEITSIFKKMNLSIKLYGQFIEGKKYLEQEKLYFERYNRFTLGFATLKKMLHLIPAELKAYFYKKLWGKDKTTGKKMIIGSKNLDDSISLIGVVRKK